MDEHGRAHAKVKQTYDYIEPLDRPGCRSPGTTLQSTSSIGILCPLLSRSRQACVRLKKVPQVSRVTFGV
jgi:hypothetical protein